jgi:MFS family permease
VNASAESGGERGSALSRWFPLAILGAAQFVMVLDSSVMNVSISQIVADLNTTVQGVQLAITAYTLVMAAFMLVGAKLGDIWGRNRTFAIGLAVYGVGSLTTALSPNLPVLLIGWSLVEGLGAVLVIPAIAALIVSLYEGKERALAYGLIGGVAGAAIAAGPLIGGWVTTTFSWRWVFVGEVVVVVVILLFRRRMANAPRVENPPRLDLVGAALSSIGLGLIVFAVLKSSTWGWIAPLNPPEIGGHELTPFGFSIVPFLILAGFGVLAGFGAWEQHCEAAGRDTLLDRSLLKIPTLRAGLSTLATQQLVLMGTFFVLPVYLQIVLGLDAFETGKRLFPMSIAMLVAALLGPRLAARFAPRHVCQMGLTAIAGASFLLLGTIDVELNGAAFGIALAIFGIGAGLLISQLGNVIMSSVDPSRTNEAGGLQGTAQNLGASLGTALIGAVLMTGLTSGFVAHIKDNPKLPARVEQQVTSAATESGLQVVTVDQVQKAATDAGLSRADAEVVAASYGTSLLDALKRSLGAVAVLALLGTMLTRNLPTRAAAERPDDLASEGAAVAPVAGGGP